MSMLNIVIDNRCESHSPYPGISVTISALNVIGDTDNG